MLKVNRRGTKYIEIDGVITEKYCNSCGEMKELDQFHNQKTGLGGKTNKCKPCAIEYQENHRKKKTAADYREYYMRNKERINAYNRKRYQELKAQKNLPVQPLR